MLGRIGGQWVWTGVLRVPHVGENRGAGCGLVSSGYLCWGEVGLDWCPQGTHVGRER